MLRRVTGYVVDLDLEQFFDRVNQDRLMSRVAERVSDKRLLKLIRAFLTAGVMENGVGASGRRGNASGRTFVAAVEQPGVGRA